MGKVTKSLILFINLLIISSIVYSAPKGTLKVNIIDDEGSALPGVSVTLSSPIMMGTKTMITNEEGECLFINLDPGIYQIKAFLEGFQETIAKEIQVSMDKQTSIRIVLSPAVLEETVTVTASSPAVDTTKSVIAEYVTHQTVESLPIARDFVGYLQLASGVNVVPNSQGRDTPEDPAGKGGLNYSDLGGQGIGGKRGSRDNFYFIDGMNITGHATQTAGMTFNNEVIQEQELLTSGVPAEYGGGKGVVGNIVTKSGGNRLSGSINFYLQPKNFYLPYGGSEYEKASDPTKLEGYKDNKYDTAFTLGGPFIKDKFWFFTSGQYRKDSSKFKLSESASSIREEVDYSNKRWGLFGKLSFKLTANDSFNLTYFLDDYTIVGTRDQNMVKTRQPLEEYNMGVYSAYYQRVFGDKLIVDFRYGRYWWSYQLGPRYPEAGVPDTLFYLPGTYPNIENYVFGGYDWAADDRNTRDQLSANAEFYLGNMRLKSGFMYANEYDKDDSYHYYGEDRYSLDPHLIGITLGELYDKDVIQHDIVDFWIIRELNSNWSATSDAIDTNDDNIVSMDELRAVTFTDLNERGLNFQRTATAKRGVNKVRAQRFFGYLMDDWKISDYFTLNAGLRIEKHNYYDSEGGTILKMPIRLLPRVGLVWNIGGRGTHKLTLFYGQFSDPMPFGMIHFAGNISGRITNQDIWLNHAWYTYRTRGKAEQRDCVWTPNTRDNWAHELSLTHQIDLGSNFVLTSQVYYRGDRNIIEDYDFYTYIEYAKEDPFWAPYALTYQDFGYGPEGPPGYANYFLSNLIGAKRDIYGFDFEVSKKFSNGTFIVGQYSFKHALGNSQSDGNADLQGDLLEVDPRTPWMWGPTPGTIPHKIKIFGTYRTSFGLDIGCLFYWNSGMVFTESFVAWPIYMGGYFINWPLNEEWTSFAKTGQERTPSYYQLDLKFNYALKLMGPTLIEFFVDVYNITNNQAAIDIAYGRNDPKWNYKETTEILLPMRFYLGARVRF